MTVNRPDIIIKQETKKECMLIDTGVDSVPKASTKVTEKLPKHKHLEIAIKRTW